MIKIHKASLIGNRGKLSIKLRHTDPFFPYGALTRSYQSLFMQIRSIKDNQWLYVEYFGQKINSLAPTSQSEWEYLNRRILSVLETEEIESIRLVLLGNLEI